MVKKKERLGSDPLSWIRDSRGDGKQSKHSGLGKRHKRSKAEHSSILGSSMAVRGKSPTVGTETTRAGLKGGWTRATFIIREEHLEKVKAVAYWDRKEIKQVVDEALSSYLKNKRVEPIG